MIVYILDYSIVKLLLELPYCTAADGDVISRQFIGDTTEQFCPGASA